MASANSAEAAANITKMARMWSNEMKYAVAYAIPGISVIMTPAINFSKSWVNARILPLAAELKKSLISKMLAEAIASMVINGIKIARGEVSCFMKAMPSKVKGTGTKVAVDIKVLEVIILLAFIGNVLV